MLAAFECSWLSREEISTAARSAPATAQPAPEERPVKAFGQRHGRAVAAGVERALG
jgi:hypothetical protein